MNELRRGALVAAAPGLWASANRARLSILRPFLFAGAIVSGPRASRAVALTFDDGPHPEHTPLILHALGRVGARATFFFTGRAVEEYPELARRVAEQHEIGTHLYSHDRRVTRTVEAFEDEARRCQEIHARVLGTETRALRFPFGDAGRIGASQARRLGLTTYHWTFSSEDSSATSAGEVVDHVVPRLHAGAIVLFHDGRAAGSTKGTGSRRPTVEALPQILDAALRRGLRFATVSEFASG